MFLSCHPIFSSMQVLEDIFHIDAPGMRDLTILVLTLLLDAVHFPVCQCVCFVSDKDSRLDWYIQYEV